MRVRGAVPADAGAIRTLHEAAIREFGPLAYSRTQVDAWARGCESVDYIAAIEADDVEFIVADIDDDIGGFGSLRLGTPLEYELTVDAEVTAVYVHPSVARQGIGTRLYRELERRARAHGATRLGLSASLNAVPFYEAQGYERVSEHDHEFSSHDSTGVVGTVVEMGKRLDGADGS